MEPPRSAMTRRWSKALGASSDDLVGQSLDWSDFNFDSHFDDLSGRNGEIGGRSFGVALHESVQALPPYRHAGNVLGRNNRLPAQVVRDFRQVSATELLIPFASKAEAFGDSGTFHEAVMQNHPGETRGKVLDFRTFILGDARR